MDKNNGDNLHNEVCIYWNGEDELKRRKQDQEERKKTYLNTERKERKITSHIAKTSEKQIKIKVWCTFLICQW